MPLFKSVRHNHVLTNEATSMRSNIASITAKQKVWASREPTTAAVSLPRFGLNSQETK